MTHVELWLQVECEDGELCAVQNITVPDVVCQAGVILDFNGDERLVVTDVHFTATSRVVNSAFVRLLVVPECSYCDDKAHRAYPRTSAYLLGALGTYTRTGTWEVL